jgi:very-short-patch-repair endonuclease
MSEAPRKFARSLRKTATAAEVVLWQALRGRRLKGLKFKRQQPFLSYTVDFLCFEKKLIVEIDGAQHAWYAEYDSRRTQEIEHHGFTVLRFTNSDVLEDLETVTLRIATAAQLPAAHPHPWPLSHPGEGRR